MAIREEEPLREEPSRREPIKDWLVRVFGSPQPELLESGSLEAGTVVVMDMNLSNNKELQPFINFLLDKQNRVHFANPPRNLDELRKTAEDQSKHFLVAKRVETDENNKLVRRVVGGALIEDAGTNQHDHFISLVVADPVKQGQGLGQKLLLQTIEYGFSTESHDRRPRTKLDLAIIMGVEPADAKTIEVVGPVTGKVYHTKSRMEAITIKLGFKMTQNLPRQVNVPGFSEPLATRRYELLLDNWKELIEKNSAFSDYIKSLRS